jgi:hypothetical protein
MIDNKTPEQIAAERYPHEYSGHLRAAHVEGYNYRQPEVDELKRQVEELMAFNETCLQNNKSLTAAKERELDDLKRQMEDMQSRLIKAMSDVNHLEATHDAEMCAFAEWVGVRGWEYSSTNWCFWDINHELISVKTTTELLTKFRELEAANCDHKNCLNYSQYLRQNHSEDKLDMRDPLAEAWDSEEDKIWDTLD